jgi:hypothetical protein
VVGFASAIFSQKLKRSAVGQPGGKGEVCWSPLESSLEFFDLQFSGFRP